MPNVSINTAGIDEAARRLRSLDAWDNKLGDLLQMMLHQIAALEQFAAPHLAVDEKTGKPTRIASWDEFDQRLTSFFSLHWLECGNVCHVPAAALLSIARLSGKWRDAGAAPPATLRSMGFGSLVLEWEKPGCSLIFDGGVPAKVGKLEHFRQHGLILENFKND